MTVILNLITEDLPSELICEQIITAIDGNVHIGNRLGRCGVGYIKNKLRGFNEAAVGMKFVVLADRDNLRNCPVNMIQEWIGGPRNDNLVVRFAEMEIEAWIMADREKLSTFLEVPLVRIPMNVDQLDDPKQSLVNAARSSRNSRIRDEMCPVQGASNRVGPAYNDRLESFIRNEWRMAVAAQNSPSLQRAERRIRELIDRV
jgi:hypothetical protein